MPTSPSVRSHTENSWVSVQPNTQEELSVGFRKYPFESINQAGFELQALFSPKQKRSWFQRVSSNDMVLGLIIANVAVFCLWKIADGLFMYKNFTISLYQIRSGRLHTLITSAFSHIHVGHIVSNMMGLYVFGMNIGRVFGPGFLLKLHLAGATGGSVFYLVHHAFLAASSKINFAGQIT